MDMFSRLERMASRGSGCRIRRELTSYRRDIKRLGEIPFEFYCRSVHCTRYNAYGVRNCANRSPSAYFALASVS